MGLQLRFQLMRLVALDSRQALVGEVPDIFEPEASIFVIIEAVEVPQMVEVDFQLLEEGGLRSLPGSTATMRTPRAFKVSRPDGQASMRAKGIRSVAQLAVRPGVFDPARYDAALYDYVLFTPRTTDEDPCVRFKKQLEQMRKQRARR